MVDQRDETAEQTPEDEVAEIKLRIALKLYDAGRAVRLVPHDLTRPSATSQTDAAAAACIVELSKSMMDEWAEAARERSHFVLRPAPKAWLNGLVDNGGMPHPSKITRADRIRRALDDADHGRFVRGECAGLWHSAWTHW